MIAAAELADRTAHARDAGRLATQRAGDGAPARAFPQRRSLLNAMTGIAASGGSTNGILHLLAIAREAGVALTIDELSERAAATPVIANLTPGGRYVGTDLHAAGGVPVLIRELIRAGLVDGDAPMVGGGTMATATHDAPAPNGDVTYTCDAPFKARSGLRLLRGNLAPTAPWPGSPAPSAAATSAPRECSTARRRASPRSPPGRSPPATSWSSATQAPACAR
jgi:dihydroxy-acid dehydratase